MASMRPNRSRWSPLIAGLLIGLVASSGLVYAWNRPYNDHPALMLLGSGNGLSALITTNRLRLLVTGGNDPGAFANAIGDARPMTAPRIDILVITPGSARVSERAIAITNPAQILELAGTDGERVDPSAQIIRHRIDLSLGPDMTLTIDPGIIVGSAIAGWSMAIATNGGTILLAEQQPVRAPNHLALLAIMGNDPPSSAFSPDSALVVSADIAGDFSSNTYPVGAIEPGDVARIRISNDAIQLPGAWRKNIETRSNSSPAGFAVIVGTRLSPGQADQRQRSDRYRPAPWLSPR